LYLSLTSELERLLSITLFVEECDLLLVEWLGRF